MAAVEQRLSSVLKHPLIADLPILDAIAKEKLYEVGHPASYIVLLREGAVFIGTRRRGEKPNGELKTVYNEIIKSPALIGEEGLVSQDTPSDVFTPRSTFAEAIIDSRYQIIHPLTLRQMLLEEEIFFEVYGGLSKRLAGLQSHFLETSGLTFPGRVGVGLVKFASIADMGVRFTDETMARFVKVSRPSFSTAVQTLSNVGIVVGSKYSVNAEKLEEYLAENRAKKMAEPRENHANLAQPKLQTDPEETEEEPDQVKAIFTSFGSSNKELRILARFTDKLKAQLGINGYLTDAHERELVSIIREFQGLKNPGIRAQAKARAAVSLFILCNINSLEKAASFFQYSNLGRNDLVNEGVIGIIEALKNFDPERSRFLTYADYFIRKYMRVAANRQIRLLYIPRNVHYKIQRLMNIEGRLFQDLERLDITDEELADELEWPIKTVKTIRKALNSHTVQESVVKGDDGEEIAQAIDELNADPTIDLEGQAEKEILHQTVNWILDRYFSAEHGQIIRLRYGIALNGEDVRQHSQAEVAIMRGVSEQWISEREKRILGRLRQPRFARLLRDFT